MERGRETSQKADVQVGQDEGLAQDSGSGDGENPVRHPPRWHRLEVGIQEGDRLAVSWLEQQRVFGGVVQRDRGRGGGPVFMRN